MMIAVLRALAYLGSVRAARRLDRFRFGAKYRFALRKR